MHVIGKRNKAGEIVARITIRPDGLATAEIPSLGMVMSGRDVSRLADWADAELAEAGVI